MATAISSLVTIVRMPRAIDSHGPR
jgi:hypothetical protein